MNREKHHVFVCKKTVYFLVHSLRFVLKHTCRLNSLDFKSSFRRTSQWSSCTASERATSDELNSMRVARCSSLNRRRIVFFNFSYRRDARPTTRTFVFNVKLFREIEIGDHKSHKENIIILNFIAKFNLISVIFRRQSRRYFQWNQRQKIENSFSVFHWCVLFARSLVVNKNFKWSVTDQNETSVFVEYLLPFVFRSVFGCVIIVFGREWRRQFLCDPSLHCALLIRLFGERK